MDLQLQKKHALVTGSTGGIGLAIAAALAKEGAVVTVNGRTKERVEEAKASIVGEVLGADVRGVAADLSTAEGVEQLLQALPEIDILVNNLGIYGATPFLEISDAEWLRFFETNVMSGVRLSRAYGAASCSSLVSRQ
jgi:hypothetical protein